MSPLPSSQVPSTSRRLSQPNPLPAPTASQTEITRWVDRLPRGEAIRLVRNLEVADTDAWAGLIPASP